MPPRSCIGLNSALKSDPLMVATLLACTGWQPRTPSPPMSPQLCNTLRRIRLRSGLQ